MSLGLLDRDEFIEQYGAALAAGQGSVLVGAGLSRDPGISATVDDEKGGLPGWKALLEPLAEKFDVPLEDDLPLVAQYVANQDGGVGAIHQRLIDVFSVTLSNSYPSSVGTVANQSDLDHELRQPARACRPPNQQPAPR